MPIQLLSVPRRSLVHRGKPCEMHGPYACDTLLTTVQSDMWQLLFHSIKHGQSFNTFMGKVGESETFIAAKQPLCDHNS